MEKDTAVSHLAAEIKSSMNKVSNKKKNLKNNFKTPTMDSSGTRHSIDYEKSEILA